MPSYDPFGQPLPPTYGGTVEPVEGTLLEAYTPGYGPATDVPVHETRQGSESTRSDAENMAALSCRMMANNYGYTEFSIHINNNDDAIHQWEWFVSAIKYIDIDDGSDE